MDRETRNIKLLEPVIKEYFDNVRDCKMYAAAELLSDYNTDIDLFIDSVEKSNGYVLRYEVVNNSEGPIVTFAGMLLDLSSGNILLGRDKNTDKYIPLTNFYMEIEKFLGTSKSAEYHTLLIERLKAWDFEIDKFVEMLNSPKGTLSGEGSVIKNLLDEDTEEFAAGDLNVNQLKNIMNEMLKWYSDMRGRLQRTYSNDFGKHYMLLNDDRVSIQGDAHEFFNNINNLYTMSEIYSDFIKSSSGHDDKAFDEFLKQYSIRDVHRMAKDLDVEVGDLGKSEVIILNMMDMVESMGNDEPVLDMEELAHNPTTNIDITKQLWDKIGIREYHSGRTLGHLTLAFTSRDNIASAQKNIAQAGFKDNVFTEFVSLERQNKNMKQFTLGLEQTAKDMNRMLKRIEKLLN